MTSVLDSLPAADRADARRGSKQAEPTRPELTDVCIVTLDCGLRVVEAGGEFLYQLGRSAGEVYGMPFADFVHPSVRQVVLQQLSRLAEGRRARFSSRLAGLSADGNGFSADVTGVAVRGDRDRVSTIVLMVRPDRLSQPPRTTADRRKLLSELDARVLEGVAAGISTVQLASKLYLSRQGIEYHVGAMLRRFKSPNRSALVARAYSQGILCIGHWPPKVTPEYIR